MLARRIYGNKIIDSDIHMKRYKYHFIILTIFLFFIIFSLKSIFFFKDKYFLAFPCNMYNEVPRIIEGITAIFVIISYFGTMHYLFIREKRIDPQVKYLKSFSWCWFFLRPFLSRYKNVNYIVWLYSFMITSFAFSISIPFTYFFIVHYKSDADYANNPLIFFHSQGIFISFVGMFLVVSALLNTLILKAKYDREIETLEELFYILSERINKRNDKEWSKFANIYYYIYDYTIATGHYSEPNRFYIYAQELRYFLERNKVDFKGIIYEYENNLEYYKKLIDNGQGGKTKEIDNEVINILFEANDVFITYLNKDYYGRFRDLEPIKKNCSYKKQDPIRIIDKIMYQSYRKGTALIRPGFFRSILRVDSLEGPEKDEQVIKYSDSLFDGSSVYQTKEIGITRFIVTNLFVIQFIATREKSKNVVTGYISEDITTIERFKNTFCEYRKYNHINNK